ncbi:cytosolic iron-sulfur assembly component 3-like isoform X1 [Halichondria panicea]|uniref:cytosolic iron-sulfur assembly component 3-like isoform X1 n=2 Tax=Halichondria panicea TaxID=6063 RepID=UPI00312B39D4
MAGQGFSSALKLTDLNDFITPSQECIMPVKIDKSSSKAGAAAVSIDSDGTYLELDEKGQKHYLKKATITLSDCLACSGCVTSAETVLLQQQSQAELLRVIQDNEHFKEIGDIDKVKVVVLSLSPQSRASLAVDHKLTDVQQAGGKLVTFFKKLGVQYVFDTTFSRDFSLLESAREFVRRYKSSSDKSLPMLTSACPGWVCYAEKVHGSFVLPYISTAKSPQQVMGSLVKDYFAKLLMKRPDQLFHVAVMPCFDKKLEASRSDFYDDVSHSKDVDCVLTTGEVNALIKEQEVVLSNLDVQQFDKPFSGSGVDDIYVHAGGGAGGYLEAVLNYSANKLFGLELKDISYKNLRNKDMREVVVKIDEKTELKFAAAYGFRNIQNLMQKLRRGRCNYHFVEVMACPSGCLNGGGQIHASLKADAAKVILPQVEQIYNGLKVKLPEENEAVQVLYREWLQGDSVESCSIEKLLHTTYHHIETQTTSLAIKW